MYKKISKYLLIEWVVKRTKKSKNLDEIVIATLKNADKVFGKIAKKLKVKIYFGDENNVLARFLRPQINLMQIILFVYVQTILLFHINFLMI